MRAAARYLVLAVISGVALVGGVTAPAQAALIKKPVTTGYVQLTLDSPLSTAFGATKPGRNSTNGMFFPVSGVTKDGVSVAGQLSVTDPRPPAKSEVYPIKVEFNRVDGTGSIVLAPVQVAQTFPLFTFDGMKASGPTVVVNAKKKVRVVTTTWTGDLHITEVPDVVANINTAYGLSLVPGERVGAIGIKVSVATPCKNAACTK